MKFRTEVQAPNYNFQIRHWDQLMLLGSCFSDEIGAKFQHAGFHVMTNPFGTLYNPISITNALNHILEQRSFLQDDLLFAEDRWLSLDHNTSFQSNDAAELVERINTSIEQAYDFLKSTKFLFLTVGSAWVFKHLSSDRIVANCHKLPSTDFQRELLEIGEIQLAFREALDKLKRINPSCSVLFTVSPVRHLRDGMISNTRSKSILHAALHAMNLDYFPAYEMINDDLRDYRFYTEDLCHVNDLGVAYVWEKIQDWLVDAADQRSIDAVLKHRKLSLHRPSDITEHEIHIQRSKTQLINAFPFLRETIQ
ncbi:MAG: GSCFA domain-containing protein [Saprospiraceae bacterium]|nr:GSCFA domain-containing protein [Saprospiraceae bacterium]